MCVCCQSAGVGAASAELCCGNKVTGRCHYLLLATDIRRTCVCVCTRVPDYLHVKTHAHMPIFGAACMPSSRLSVKRRLGLLTCFCFYRALVTAIVVLPLRCGKCILLTQNVVVLLFFLFCFVFFF